MINIEEYNLHKSIIDWLVSNGLTFMEAMAVVAMAHNGNRTIPDAYTVVKLSQAV